MTARHILRPLTIVATASALAAPVPVIAATSALADSRTPSASAEQGRELSWVERPTGSTAQLRGLAAVNHRVAWVSGSAGTVLRTDDGGRTWDDVSPGGDTGELEFRDIEAFDAYRAVILSIGEAGDSRIYRTSDGGHTWHLGFQNNEAAAFYDCMDFWDPWHGLAMSDPVDGKIRILSTRNGGRSWSVVDPAGMPEALPGEFAFAASGTCLVTAGSHNAWIATGGGAQSRVLHSSDRGQTWSAATTPVASTEAGGIFSLAVRPTFRPRSGLRYDVAAVGGDYLDPDRTAATSAYSQDSGASWTGGGDLGGYRSGAAWLPRNRAAVLAVGPTGTDLSRDGGRTWTAVDSGSLDGVQCTWDGACWASGAAGRVTVLRGLGHHW